MNPADPLAGLRDIHAPDVPGLWPPAPGWTAAACLLVAVVAATAVVAVRRWRAGRFRRDALTILRSLRARHAAGTPDSEIAMELSMLVRRVALARHPRADVAGLTGDRWMARLESTLPGIEASVGPALLHAPYARRCDFDVGRALVSCEHWIRRA